MNARVLCAAAVIAFGAVGDAFAAYRIIAEDMGAGSSGSGLSGIIGLALIALGLLFGDRRLRIWLLLAFGTPCVLAALFGKLWLLTMMFSWLPALWAVDLFERDSKSAEKTADSTSHAVRAPSGKKAEVLTGATGYVTSRSISCHSCGHAFTPDEKTVWVYGSVCKCPRCGQSLVA